MKLPRILEILKIEPFKITCKWNNGEVRVIDLESKIQMWQSQKDNILANLADIEKFYHASVSDSQTLEWKSILWDFIDLSGERKQLPLDLDPDVLYAESKPLESYRLVLVA